MSDSMSCEHDAEVMINVHDGCERLRRLIESKRGVERNQEKDKQCMGLIFVDASVAIFRTTATCVAGLFL